VTALVAATTPSTLWYLTRGSGVVALLLLTASICLGIATTIRWRTSALPRFAVAGLHRSLTLLAIVFVAIHVATTVADGFAPIGWKDAFVPFLSPYRPIWLGLGAVAFDLLLALVVTSLLRARIGHRVWRATHWLAYASWPVALVHSLGTGSDARVGWLYALGVGSILAVGATLAVRLALSPAELGRRLAAGAAALAVVFGIGTWYRSGPGALGWAGRAGTPAALLAHSTSTGVTSNTPVTLVSLPSSFQSRLVGRLAESQSGNGLIDVRIDGTLSGDVRGQLRLVLQGVPLEGGGVSMTANGVAFAAAGSSSVYEGRIIGLDGTRITARVADGSKTIDLQIALNLKANQTRVSGVVQGTVA
jgi:sulfoxide reductase heme-binding subunit YedZ